MWTQKRTAWAQRVDKDQGALVLEVDADQYPGLQAGDVLADFDARKVVLMRADWTRRDPAITQALTALGRSGVPVYALYAPGQAPVLLSELPSVAEVQAALQKLPPAK